MLATRLEGSVVVPLASDLEYRLLLRPGGIGDLDGYSGSELYTRAYLLAGAEYRHVFFNNLDINVVHLAWLRSLGGVLSAGAVSMAHCDDYGGLLAADSWYGQVGYGLFGYTYLLGVAPQLVRLDVSVPLVRRDTVCLGNAFPQYLADRQNLDSAEGLLAPVNVNLTFVQPF